MDDVNVVAFPSKASVSNTTTESPTLLAEEADQIIARYCARLVMLRKQAGWTSRLLQKLVGFELARQEFLANQNSEAGEK